MGEFSVNYSSFGGVLLTSRCCAIADDGIRTYGYHGDDGKAHHKIGSNYQSRPYGPLFGTSDVIGCLVNYYDRTISYTRNGSMIGESLLSGNGTEYFLGVAFHGCQQLEQLVPTAALQSSGERISFNFGASPFLFDVHQYARESCPSIPQLPVCTEDTDIYCPPKNG